MDDTKVLLKCSCDNEFVEFERVTYADDSPETMIYIYHLHTSIKMSMWQKLRSCWRVLRHGRAILYDIVLTDDELKKLQTWVKGLRLSK